MHEFWKWLGIVAGGFVGLGIFVWVIMFSIMLYKDFDRGMAMLGGLTMFVRGIRRKEGHKHKHRRQTDATDHEHVRRPSRPSLFMTITDFARKTPTQPRRRSGDSEKED